MYIYTNVNIYYWPSYEEKSLYYCTGKQYLHTYVHRYIYVFQPVVGFSSSILLEKENYTIIYLHMYRYKIQYPNAFRFVSVIYIHI